MNSKSLKSLLAAIVVLCAAALVGAALYLRKKHGAQNTARATRLGPNTFVVAQLDIAQMRTWPIANGLHRRFTTQDDTQERGMREASRAYRDMVTNCGFDPYDQLTGIVVGADRTALAGTNPDAIAIFADGPYNPANVSRCINWFSTHNHLTASSGLQGGHTVWTMRSEGSTSTHGPQIALLDNALLGTDQSFMPGALAIADGTQPGLSPDAPLNVMLTRLGTSNMANVAVDVAAVRAQNQRDVDELVDEAVRTHPAIPNLVLAKQITVGGFAARVLNNAVTNVVRAELPSAAVAQQFTAAMQSLLNAHRNDANDLIGQARAGIASMRAIGSLRGGRDLSAQFDQLNAALDVLAALPGQVTVTTDGTHTVITLPITAQQVTTLETAVRALGEIVQDAAAGRNRAPALPEGPGPLLDDRGAVPPPPPPGVIQGTPPRFPAPPAAQVPSQGANPSAHPAH